MIDYRLIKILKDISFMMEINGENPFKASAYTKAADAIKEHEVDIDNAIKQGTLTDVPGIGKALEAKLKEYSETGTIELYEKLRQEIPFEMIELTYISTVGARKAKELYTEHNIKSIDDLERAAREGTLRRIKGFGAKSEQTVINSILHYKESKGHVLYYNIEDTVNDLVEALKDQDEVDVALPSGQFRRFNEILSSIDIVLSGKNSAKSKLDGNTQYLEEYDLNINFHFASPDNLPLILHNSTGSRDYVEKFNDQLKEKKYFVEEGHLIKDGKIIKIKDEKELYKLAGIQYVEPEMREFPGVLELAKKNMLPKLIDQNDLKGMLHNHSTWSDGDRSIKQMADGAKERGFEYFAICDHSKTAAYAGGLTFDKLIKQHEEIDQLNAMNDTIPVLKGIESDILSDGALDYPPEVLDNFDLVVASVHSGFKMNKADMTRRIIYALKSPYTTILGHATGRLLLARPPYNVDIKDVIQAAADYGKVIEINSNPHRLDLSWENVIFAKEKGVKFAINPDAHDLNEMDFVYYGIKVARKAGLETKDVVNCLSYDDFCKQFNIKKVR